MKSGFGISLAITGQCHQTKLQGQTSMAWIDDSAEVDTAGPDKSVNKLVTAE